MSDTPRDNLSVLVEFADPAHRDAVARLLAKESRPDFDDELEDWERAIFEQVEDVEYPGEIVEEGKRLLFVHWREVDESVEELDERLRRCGGEMQKAQRFLGDPYTDDTLDGMYYRRKGGRMVLVDPEEHGLVMPDDLPADGRLPQWAGALLQDF